MGVSVLTERGGGCQCPNWTRGWVSVSYLDMEVGVSVLTGHGGGCQCPN